MNPANLQKELKDSRDFDEFQGKVKELMTRRLAHVADDLFWLAMEFPKLQKEEKKIVQNLNLANNSILKNPKYAAL